MTGSRIREQYKKTKGADFRPDRISTSARSSRELCRCRRWSGFSPTYTKSLDSLVIGRMMDEDHRQPEESAVSHPLRRHVLAWARDLIISLIVAAVIILFVYQPVEGRMEPACSRRSTDQERISSISSRTVSV